MKKITTFAALIVTVTTACKKDEVNPLNLAPKDKVIECRTCQGQWDLTDTIPKK